MTNKLGNFYTYRALLEAVTTGSSLRRVSSEVEYFCRSNSSRSFSDDSKMNTRADHWAGDSLSAGRLPEFRYCWTSSTRVWSLSSFRQWKRLMLLSGGRSLLILSLTYWTVSRLIFALLPVFVSRPRRRFWLVCSERPSRKRRKRSRCPFGLCKALSTAFW